MAVLKDPGRRIAGWRRENAEFRGKATPERFLSWNASRGCWSGR